MIGWYKIILCFSTYYPKAFFININVKWTKILSRLHDKKVVYLINIISIKLISTYFKNVI